jgi:hypothetical protein
MYWERVKGAFRETPWTMAISFGALAVWLLSFFSVKAPMEVLGGNLDVPHAWRWVTYPLANPVPPSGFLWLALGLWCFTLFAGPLERGWGSLRFGRVFLVLTLCAAVAEWLAYGAATKSFPPTVAGVYGLRVPAGAIFMIWAALNRDMTILFMFVVPIQARYLAIASVVLMFFDDRGPIFGLAASAVLVCAWFWATGRGRAVAAKSSRRSLSQWWADRKKAKRKGRFQLLEGGAPMASPPRVGSLQSLTRTPPKPDEPSEVELNRILDKIRFEGMGSLTEAERATLDGQSKRLRGDT